jgi:hypothetical protein
VVLSCQEKLVLINAISHITEYFWRSILINSVEYHGLLEQLFMETAEKEV